MTTRKQMPSSIPFVVNRKRKLWRAVATVLSFSSSLTTTSRTWATTHVIKLGSTTSALNKDDSQNASTTEPEAHPPRSPTEGVRNETSPQPQEEAHSARGEQQDETEERVVVVDKQPTTGSAQSSDSAAEPGLPIDGMPHNGHAQSGFAEGWVQSGHEESPPDGTASALHDSPLSFSKPKNVSNQQPQLQPDMASTSSLAVQPPASEKPGEHGATDKHHAMIHLRGQMLSSLVF
ncbi:unnamed protein product [Amoebophrya sp. A25]|nr:unnamed protein product [Amoebophrya sp. A25]|eukprot:GSA25T00021560001.1